MCSTGKEIPKNTLKGNYSKLCSHIRTQIVQNQNESLCNSPQIGKVDISGFCPVTWNKHIFGLAYSTMYFKRVQYRIPIVYSSAFFAIENMLRLNGRMSFNLILKCMTCRFWLSIFNQTSGIQYEEPFLCLLQKCIYSNRNMMLWIIHCVDSDYDELISGYLYDTAILLIRKNQQKDRYIKYLAGKQSITTF
jgi:hypothetical protein